MRTRLALISFALVLGSAAIASAWTAPTQSPPNGNVAAPINTSANGQVKSGDLGVLGRFGAGTATPSAKLEINTLSDASISTPAIKIATYGTGNSSNAAIQFTNSNTSQLWQVENAYDGSFRIGRPTDSPSGAYPVFITAAGNVGVGMVPVQKLDVNGMVRASASGTFGVYGQTSGNGYGVYGTAASAGGVGVRGDGQAYGGYFSSLASGAGAYVGYGSYGLYTGNNVYANDYYDAATGLYMSQLRLSQQLGAEYTGKGSSTYVDCNSGAYAGTIYAYGGAPYGPPLGSVLVGLATSNSCDASGCVTAMQSYCRDILH